MMSELLLKGSRIYTESGPIEGALLIRDKKLVKIIEDKSEIDSFTGTLMDMGDNYIIPGLIDIHIHGGGGWQAESTDPEDIIGFNNYLPSLGVTSYLPTVGGGTKDSIKESLANIAKTVDTLDKGSRILGIHLEGPFINKEKKGAFDESRLLKPSAATMEEFLKASNHMIKYITMAPEIEDAYDLMDYLTENNIVITGGHTNATYEETIDGIDHGVKSSTHTGNGQSGIHHRQPGAFLGYIMDDRVYCELISDFYHIHKAVVDMIIRLKTTDKVCLISDTTFVANLEAGKYDFLGNIVTMDKEGWCRLGDGTIAGSTKSLLDGVRNIVKNLGYSLEDVIKMSSLNQAKLLGLDKDKGSIGVGKDADIIVLDDDFNLLYTLVEGSVEFNSKEDDKSKLINSSAKEYLVESLD